MRADVHLAVCMKLEEVVHRLTFCQHCIILLLWFFGTISVFIKLLFVVLFASDGRSSSVQQLALPCSSEQTSSASQLGDCTTNQVPAKMTEPSVVDFDKINSRFMMLRQQSGYGFVVAEDFLNFS